MILYSEREKREKRAYLWFYAHIWALDYCGARSQVDDGDS
jgi:hypothetical protein